MSWQQSLSTVILEPKKRKYIISFIYLLFCFPGIDGTRCHNLIFLMLFQSSFLTLLPSFLTPFSVFKRVIRSSSHFLSLEWLLLFSTQSCPTLCNPMVCSMPDLYDLHYLPEFAQIHVHWIDDAVNHLILDCSLLFLSLIFPSIKVFSMSQLFTSHGQRIAVSESVFPVNIQSLFPLGLTGFITTSPMHQFFGIQPSLLSKFHICTWLLEKSEFWIYSLCWQSDVSAFL